MMPNITRGGETAGLMGYLFGKGRSNEHTQQHIVAGDAGIERDFMGKGVTSDLVLDVANYLDLPMKLHGVDVLSRVLRYDPTANEGQGANVSVGVKAAHVWHCSLSLKAEEGALESEKWGQIARDFVREMGFEDSDEHGTAGCRWVAVHHGQSTAGNDHIHIAVNLVREDGTTASVHQDYRRAQQAANTMERRYGLQVLASREEGLQVPEGTKPPELDRAERTGNATERDELRRRLRSVVAVATSESDFIGRARGEHILVRPRYAKTSPSGAREKEHAKPDKVVGYSVALTPTVGSDGRRGDVVWFAPSKLDSNLGLGQLRARWGSTRESELTALPEWETTTHKGEVSESRRRPERLPAELVQRLNMHGQNVVPDRSAGFDRHAAIDLSFSFARASEYFEGKEHGPFARASDVFAKAGARDRATTDDPGRPKRSDAALGASAAYQARLMARGVGRNSASGWLAVFRQMQRTGQALELQSAMAGRAAQAVAMNTAISGSMRAFEDIMRQQRAAAHTSPTTRRAEPGKSPGREHGRE